MKNNSYVVKLDVAEWVEGNGWGQGLCLRWEVSKEEGSRKLGGK